MSGPVSTAGEKASVTLAPETGDITQADKSAKKAAGLVLAAKIFGAVSLVALVVAGSFAYIPSLVATGILSSLAIKGLFAGAGISALSSLIMLGVFQALNRQPAEAKKAPVAQTETL